MNDSQERKKADGSREKSGASNLHIEYLPTDDVKRYPFQAPARGLAVSAFVFSLANLFSFGLLQPLACLGVVSAVIAYLKGNRQKVTYLAFAFGLIGLALSLFLTLKFGGYVADPVAFAELFADASSSSGMSSAASVVSSAVTSAAEAVSSVAG